MNTICLKDPKNPASPRMIGNLECMGDDFRRYMNRPLARVQVYVWAVACKLMPDHPSSLRILKPYRTPEINEWRKMTAGMIRLVRSYAGKIKLPIYDEAKGTYVFQVNTKKATNV